jgi:hypothetical protein
MRDFEALLRRMVARHSAGLAPEALAAEAPQAPVPHSLRAADAAGPPPALPLSPITRLPTDRHRGLKVAMITPYYKESRDMLERCMRSVQAQGLEVVHILVADGHAQDWIDGWPVRHLRLDCSHGDFGNTPRALGGLLAASEGFDAIGFIDADNWLEPQHVRDCLAAALAAPQAVDYVVAGRRLVRMDGSVMPVMTSDDRDGSHVDTNCYFMLPGSFHTLGQWAVMPKPLSCVGDRVFLASLRQQGLRAARSAAASVNYLCTWACLFTAIGEAVPDYAKSSIDLGPTSAWWRTLDPRQRDVVQRLANTPVQAWVS